MEQILQAHSLPMLLVLTIVGALIFIGFQVYRQLILPILLSKDSGAAHQKAFKRLEIIAWAVYAIVVIYYSLLSSLLVTAILLALILFAFFDFWRNFFAGLVIRFGDKIQVGDSITTNDTSGKIIAFDARAMRILNALGEEVIIPYQRINAEVRIAQKRLPKVLFKTFVLEGVVQDYAKAKQQLEAALYQNPWIILSKPINIALEDQRASLSYYVLNNDFFEKSKRRLLKDLRG